MLESCCSIFFINDIKLDDVSHLFSAREVPPVVATTFGFFCVLGNGCIKFLNGDPDTLSPPEEPKRPGSSVPLDIFF